MANTKVTGDLIASGTITAANLVSGTLDALLNSYLTTNTYATQGYVTTAVNNLIDAAPASLDTLNELAAALNDDANFATTVTNALATKLNLSGGTLTGGLHINTTSLPQLLIQNADGGTNAEKIAIELNAGDVFKIRSLNDNNTTRVDNIITANILTGNVGIGTNSPTAKLHLYVNSTNDDTFHIFNGAVRTHLLASESSNGVIYMRNSSNSNTVRINASGYTYFNGGNVGIGTTSPSAKFEVNGYAAIGTYAAPHYSQSGMAYQVIKAPSGSDSQRAMLEVHSGGGGTKGIFQSVGGNNTVYSGTLTNSNFSIGNDVVNMYFNTGGLIGINTTSPFNFGSNSAMIDLRSKTTTSVSGIFIGNSDGSARLVSYFNPGASGFVGTTSAHDLDLGTSDVSRIRIKSNGNVGIGTTSPTKQLEVKNSYNGSQLTLRSTSGNSGNAGLRFSVADSSVTTDAYHKASIWLTGDGTGNALGDLTFNVNNVASSANVGSSDERMRLTREGYLGIGTTNPGYGLHVANGVGGYSAGFDESIFIGQGGSTAYNLRFNNVTGAYNTFQQGSRIFQYFPDGNGTAEASIYFNRSNGTGGGVTSGAEISFHTTKNTYGPYGRETDEERLRITQRGELRLSATSLGIQFNGDTGAGNRLNDYEEGTWTPGFYFDIGNPTISYVNQEGYYQKIGNTVTVWFDLYATGMNSTSYYWARLSGLPFTMAGNNQYIKALLHHSGNSTFSVALRGGTNPVMYPNLNRTGFARGNDVDSSYISGHFSYQIN